MFYIRSLQSLFQSKVFFSAIHLGTVVNAMAPSWKAVGSSPLRDREFSGSDQLYPSWVCYRLCGQTGTTQMWFWETCSDYLINTAAVYISQAWLTPGYIMKEKCRVQPCHVELYNSCSMKPSWTSTASWLTSSSSQVIIHWAYSFSDSVAPVVLVSWWPQLFFLLCSHTGGDFVSKPSGVWRFMRDCCWRDVVTVTTPEWASHSVCD